MVHHMPATATRITRQHARRNAAEAYSTFTLTVDMVERFAIALHDCGPIVAAARLDGADRALSAAYAARAAGVYPTLPSKASEQFRAVWEALHEDEFDRAVALIGGVA